MMTIRRLPESLRCLSRLLDFLQRQLSQHIERTRHPRRSFTRHVRVDHGSFQAIVKMRHYGLLGNRHREEPLTWCRRLLVLVLSAAMQEQKPSEEKSPKVYCPVCDSL